MARTRVASYRRKGRKVRRHGRSFRGKHLYRGKGTRRRQIEEFERRYGKKKGAYVYGATVGNVYRERQRANARRGR
jgi:hypothetical protein